MHNNHMRTTLDIDDALMVQIRKVARLSGFNLGQTVNRLLGDGLRARTKPALKRVRGMPVIECRPGAEKPDFEALVREWKERG
jgi:hypothetical protein